MRTALSLSVGLFAAAVASAAPVDFTKDVQPILTASCVNCHGPNKAKSGVRVDSLDAITKGGLVVPGNSGKSTLFLCVSGDRDTAQMPPKGRLTKEQTATIKDWIDQGAKGGDKVANADAKPADKPAAPAKPQPAVARKRGEREKEDDDEREERKEKRERQKKGERERD